MSLIYVAAFWNSLPRWPTSVKIWMSLSLTYEGLSAASSQDWITWSEHAYAGTSWLNIDAHSLVFKFWSKMATQRQITFSIYLTYGNDSAARSQTWMNGSHSYRAQLWPMIRPWCRSSKILVRSKMAAIGPILDFVRMDLSTVRSQYLMKWPGHGHA